MKLKVMKLMLTKTFLTSVLKEFQSFFLIEYVFGSKNDERIRDRDDIKGN